MYGVKGSESLTATSFDRVVCKWELILLCITSLDVGFFVYRCGSVVECFDCAVVRVECDCCCVEEECCCSSHAVTICVESRSAAVVVGEIGIGSDSRYVTAVVGPDGVYGSLEMFSLIVRG